NRGRLRDGRARPTPRGRRRSDDRRGHPRGATARRAPHRSGALRAQTGARPAHGRGGDAMSDWLGIMWLFVLLVANAFFVGAEFAVISARRSQIEPLAEAGSRRAKTALWAMEHATLMLAMSQLGITICSLLILNVSEPAIHHLLEVPL